MQDLQLILLTSVADPHSFFADPDPGKITMRIWIHELMSTAASSIQVDGIFQIFILKQLP
jgi:hypothetical protein